MMRQRLIGIALASAFAAACGSSTPVAPTVTPPTTTTPTVTTFTLSGTVTSTTGAAISGAVVRVVDGANAGKSTTTSSSGTYAITGLAVAGQTVSASATNFMSTSKAATTSANVTLDFQLAPTPLFTVSGTGNTVFDMPTTVSRVRIRGTYTGFTSNFIVKIGGRLIVNDLLGTGWSTTVSDGTYLTSGGTVEITNSLGVAWTFTEVR